MQVSIVTSCVPCYTCDVNRALLPPFVCWSVHYLWTLKFFTLTLTRPDFGVSELSSTHFMSYCRTEWHCDQNMFVPKTKDAAVISPDILPGGWLGSKHQHTRLFFPVYVSTASRPTDKNRFTVLQEHRQKSHDNYQSSISCRIPWRLSKAVVRFPRGPWRTLMTGSFFWSVTCS